MSHLQFVPAKKSGSAPSGHGASDMAPDQKHSTINSISTIEGHFEDHSPAV